MTEEEFLIEMKNFFENIDKLKLSLEDLKNLKKLEKNNQERTYNPRVIKKLKCVEVKDETSND